MTLPFWAILALLAASVQTLRNVAQKHLSSRTSVALASGARFLFALPFAILLLIGVIYQAKPQIHLSVFWLYGLTAATSQIIASVCTTQLFKRKNFALSSVLIRSETAFVPLIAAILIQETINSFIVWALLFSLTGTIIASLAKQPKNKSTNSTTSTTNSSFPSSWSFDLGMIFWGLSAGALFALTSVAVRAMTTLGFDIETPRIVAASLTLAVVLILQSSLLIGFFIFKRIPLWADLRQKSVLMPCFLVGMLSISGSFFWFYAYALASTTSVKIVGQSEILFSILLSVFYFKDRVKPLEILGIALIVLACFLALQ